MFVKPGPHPWEEGEVMLIRDPVTRRPLPREGAEVPENDFWLRLRRDGDVRKTEPAADASGGPAPAAAANPDQDRSQAPAAAAAAPAAPAEGSAEQNAPGGQTQPVQQGVSGPARAPAAQSAPADTAAAAPGGGDVPANSPEGAAPRPPPAAAPARA